MFIHSYYSTFTIATTEYYGARNKYKIIILAILLFNLTLEFFDIVFFRFHSFSERICFGTNFGISKFNQFNNVLQVRICTVYTTHIYIYIQI